MDERKVFVHRKAFSEWHKRKDLSRTREIYYNISTSSHQLVPPKTLQFTRFTPSTYDGEALVNCIICLECFYAHEYTKTPKHVP